MKKSSACMFLVSALLVGCPPPVGDEGEGEGESEGDFDASGLADAVFAFYERCNVVIGGGPFLAEAEPVLASETLAPSRQDLIDELEAMQANPALDFDAASYAACEAAFGTVDCSGAYGEDSELRACSRMFVGNRALGEGCAGDNECAESDDTYCDGADGAACGTCAALPGVGEECDYRCATGLECTGVSPTGGSTICVEAPGDGDPCPYQECAEGLTCSDAGVCEPEAYADPALGDPCIDGLCNILVTGLTCDASNGTCIDVTVAQPGDVCDPGLEVARYCINQLAGENACIDPEVDGTYTCTPLPGVGSACVAGRCDRDVATCSDNDQCVAWPGNGEPCPDYGCAEGLGCNDDQVCEPLSETDLPVCPA